MKLPAASGRAIMMDSILFLPKGWGRSLRLINFVSQNQSLTDLMKNQEDYCLL